LDGARYRESTKNELKALSGGGPHARRSPGKATEALAQFSAIFPARQYGAPEEVAALVAFLASDDARLIYGAVFAADGCFAGS
jgi:NAD(P)-dependent dehydrogenase (short-subunit alcohol dehydrogenase family)